MIILDYRDRRPIYEQVLEKLKELMLLDVLKENDPLPSVRNLARATPFPPSAPLQTICASASSPPSGPTRSWNGRVIFIR